MSGHSKWANIKHRKGAQDAKRANVFTKMAKLIAVAAREGGGDPDTNFKLKMAIDKARTYNMPKDNIERAIKSGTGESKDGLVVEEVNYEAYGPGNVALIISVNTDNKNRTVSELKYILNKSNGKMVSSGSVSFMFKKNGVISVLPDGGNLEEIELQAIEAGAEDIEVDEERVIVYVKPDELQVAKEKLEKFGLKIEQAELAYISTQDAEPSEEDRKKCEEMIEKLYDLDDVSEVYDNLPE